MSKKYEGLVVINLKNVESSVDEVISAIGAELTEEGAKIESVENLGRREFAYESNHSKGGQYVRYIFTAAPEAITAINKRLSINTLVHQQYYQVLA